MYLIRKKQKLVSKLTGEKMIRTIFFSELYRKNGKPFPKYSDSCLKAKKYAWKADATVEVNRLNLKNVEIVNYD